MAAAEDRPFYERISGDSYFAEQVLGQAQEAYERKQALRANGIDAKVVARELPITWMNFW